MTPSDSSLQPIKHRMYALRNGALADAMRRMGAPYKIIFGLNLPQLSALAAELTPSRLTAEALWANNLTRESLLLAPMMFPVDEFNPEIARKWVSEIPAAEVADILCIKLLKKMPWACSFAEELMLSDSAMQRYTGLRLMFNLLPARPVETLAYAKAELNRGNPLTASIAHSLIQEIEFLLEEN